MAGIEDIRNERLQKLEQLKQANRAPYPADSTRTITIGELNDNFESRVDGDEVTVAGRVMALRGHGALMFIDLYDGTGRIQGYLKDDSLADFELFQDTVDVGDFIDLSGTPTVTKRGENSVLGTSWRMLTKSLQPLPEKWAGLKDDDLRFRKRYLDILGDPELRDMIEKKAHFWSVMRRFLEERGFIEVHTPTLETTTGGAEAEPFVTHHNDYDIDVYLRISVGELWQKQLMAAGLPKTYEIGRAYRNEGTSPDHLQEFTNMEFYWAYADYEMGMELVRDMYRTIATEVFDTTKFSARGHEFDLSDEWTLIRYPDEIKQQTGIDITDTDEETIRTYLTEHNVDSQAKTFERLVDSLWKYCRKNISGPAFVVGYPDFMQPLAKRSSEDEHIVEQFQVLLGGAEIGKGYSELNDPIDQRARFEHQQKLREAGDKEAMMIDTNFLEMLEHGMPPTCGFGAGDRLFSFLMDKPIRETQIFPLMKPKQE